MSLSDTLLLTAKLLLSVGLLGTSIILINLLINRIRNKELPYKSIMAISIISIFGLLICEGIIGYLIFSTQVLSASKDSTQEIIKKGISSKIAPGVQLMSNDEIGSSKDYVIKVKTNQRYLKLYIWDYAAEDGDFVQICINGTAKDEPFMIRNDVKVFTVPSNCKLEVKGTKDAGGGITYAVYIEETAETYFNTAPLNGNNTYTFETIN
jgi:hypothetical protein